MDEMIPDACVESFANTLFSLCGVGSFGCMR
jgi:hypothetical protein